MASAGATPTLRAVTIPSWNLELGAAEVAAHAGMLDEVSPGTLRIGPHAGVVSASTHGSRGSHDIAASAVETLRASGLALMPSISNLLDGRRSRGVVSAMIHDPARAARHVQEICDLVVTNRYQGVDVDYQHLAPEDRQAFGRFVARLADTLHEHVRRLSVTVYAKADERRDEPPTLVDDYRALGAAADEVRLMTWEYHGPTTAAGPLAPVDWVEDVLAYAADRIPADKLLLGVTATGYDWTVRGGVPVGHARAIDLANRHAEGRVEFDPLGEAPWFRYVAADGAAHEVWFEDARALRVKRWVAAAAGVRGILLWLSASPDPGVWAELTKPV